MRDQNKIFVFLFLGNFEQLLQQLKFYTEVLKILFQDEISYIY